MSYLTKCYCHFSEIKVYKHHASCSDVVHTVQYNGDLHKLYALKLWALQNLKRLRPPVTPCPPSTVYWPAYPVYLIQLQNTLCC